MSRILYVCVVLLISKIWRFISESLAIPISPERRLFRVYVVQPTKVI